MATQACHDELDARASRLDLTNRNDYLQFLRASLRALAPLEIAMEAAGVERVIDDWENRRRLPLLQADLLACGEMTEVAALPTPTFTETEMLGALYVLEGSRLGARVLLKRIAASGDTRIFCTTNYLSAGDPVLWTQFLRVLEAHPASDLTPLIRGARTAFDLFLAAFALEPAMRTTDRSSETSAAAI